MCYRGKNELYSDGGSHRIKWELLRYVESSGLLCKTIVLSNEKGLDLNGACKRAVSELPKRRNSDVAARLRQGTHAARYFRKPYHCTRYIDMAFVFSGVCLKPFLRAFPVPQRGSGKQH